PGMSGPTTTGTVRVRAACTAVASRLGPVLGVLLGLEHERLVAGLRAEAVRASLVLRLRGRVGVDDRSAHRIRHGCLPGGSGPRRVPSTTRTSYGGSLSRGR